MYTCILQVPYTRMYVPIHVHVHTYVCTHFFPHIRKYSKVCGIACYSSFTFTIFTLRSCQLYPMYSVQVNAQAVWR